MAFLRRVANFEKVTKKDSFVCLLQATFRRSFSDNSSTMNVADLSDAYSDTLQYVEPNLFRNYGGKTKFGGMISTLKCHEDNLLVKQTLSEPGNKRVRMNGGYTRKSSTTAESRKLLEYSLTAPTSDTPSDCTEY